MEYQIISKKRFENKLVKLLKFLEEEWSKEVADNFVQELKDRFKILRKQPFTGYPSSVPGVRSVIVGKYNRIYYKVRGTKIIVINIYDTRINPTRNKLK